ncbi:MAG: BrnA antitoxin family protein [Terriglobales bacterium]
MKGKKRVKRRGRVASLRASGSVEHECPMSRREQWRERQLELKRWLRLPKKRVTLNLDADVLAWFRGMGRGYQWEINKRLRKVTERERRAGRR